MMNQFWYKKSEYVHLFLHLLFKANHEPNAWTYKGKRFKVDSGQFITSRKTLALETGINPSKIERILKCFENDEQIEQRNLFTSRLITIVNYKKLQKKEQQMDSKRTASEQPVDTNNNDDNDNNDDKTPLACFEEEESLPVKKEKPKENDQARFVEWFSEQYERATNIKYKADRQDYIIAAKLIKEYGKEMIAAKVKILALCCSGQMEAWFAEGWQDFTIRKLSSQWNSLLPKKSEEQKKAERIDRINLDIEEHERGVNELLKQAI
jgi:hypothetical protein